MEERRVSVGVDVWFGRADGSRHVREHCDSVAASGEQRRQQAAGRIVGARQRELDGAKGRSEVSSAKRRSWSCPGGACGKVNNGASSHPGLANRPMVPSYA